MSDVKKLNGNELNEVAGGVPNIAAYPFSSAMEWVKNNPDDDLPIPE